MMFYRDKGRLSTPRLHRIRLTTTSNFAIHTNANHFLQKLLTANISYTKLDFKSLIY